MPAREIVFNETFTPVNLRFAFHVEKAIVRNCGGEVSELLHFTSEQQIRWQSRGENVQGLEGLREDGTPFTPGNPFQLCSLHT